MKTKNSTLYQLVESDKQMVLKEFRQIPGVGKSIAEDRRDLGLRSVQI